MKHNDTLIPLQTKQDDRSTGRTVRNKFLLLFVFLSSAFLIWSVFIEPDRLVIHRETILLPGWPRELDSLRIAVLSDLHTGSPYITVEKLREVVQRTNQQNPDLTLLLGDYVIHGVFGGKFIQPEVTAGELRHLRAPLGVASVLGNHDWWFDGNRMRRVLAGAGIQVLDNEVLELHHKGASLWLVGLADFWTKHPDIRGTLSKVSDQGPVIVFTHNPDLFPDIPDRVALTIAGHTHGGQVNLPWIGRPIVPSIYKKRYAAGLIHENGRQMFVTTGIGTSLIPLRFRTPPEICILTIVSKH